MKKYPRPFVTTLSRDTSDHCPCLVSISTNIPKAKVFRFKNYWMMRKEFIEVVEHGWSRPNNQPNVAKRLGSKFKNMRKFLRQWHGNLANLAKTIENNKLIILLLDSMEEFRDLTLEEWNFRKIMQAHLESLLQQKKEYWK
jgi:hypothetical protein